MGYTERISKYNLEQATTVGPEAEGVEVDAALAPHEDDQSSHGQGVITAKVVSPPLSVELPLHNEDVETK
jgi:hypothetical protein